MLLKKIHPETIFCFPSRTSTTVGYNNAPLFVPLNGLFAIYVNTFDEVDLEYAKAVEKGAQSILEPTTEPWGQRTCYIADPEGNLIEIGSFNRPFESRSDFNDVQ